MLAQNELHTCNYASDNRHSVRERLGRPIYEAWILPLTLYTNLRAEYVDKQKTSGKETKIQNLYIFVKAHA